jgi:hypothetical protein
VKKKRTNAVAFEQEKKKKIIGIRKYISTINLNVNGLNSQIKRHTLDIKHRIPIFVVYKRHTALAHTHTG